ncbi:hypothetical protein HKT18_13150 [Flavobacterium sp. IMCC34852]|uniref:Uncharacterized protein n=1 Tax=Flavobacterium rivulicola TaxID=2732161 RepID=A0A7Y3VYY1_9FLAO|nr:hypothetical protein [Flavobacterium sp. IMCC34852]NNT72139.1 hypothetical protein [Flavobacterium sp. IMCC34852]NNT73166.1 hypothetical protein [Flavobacterium sp. IMCC34852]
MSKSSKFNSQRIYRIWMYTVSHSTLILRSEKQYFDVDYAFKYDEPDLTIDVIFNGVDFISIPDSFNEIEIKKEGEKFIFNNNENWYVKAANCIVGQYDGDDEDKIWEMSLKYNETIEL